MSETSEDNSEYFDFLSQITIYTDEKNGDMSVACDWQQNDAGVFAIAETLFSLKYGNLPDKILQVLYDRCVEDNMEDQYILIESYIAEKKKRSAIQDEKPLIKPRDAC